MTTYSRSSASPSWKSTSPRVSLIVPMASLERRGRLVLEAGEQRRLLQHLRVHATSCRLGNPGRLPLPITPAAGDRHARRSEQRRRLPGYGRPSSVAPGKRAKRLVARPTRRPRTTAPGLRWSGAPAASTAGWPTPTRRRTASWTSRRRCELLVATILSAQSTDKRVNLVTPTAVRALPGRGGLRRRRPRRARGDDHSNRLLPRQDATP